MKLISTALLLAFSCTLFFAQNEKTPLSAANKRQVLDLMKSAPDSVEVAIAVLDGDKTNYYGFQKIGSEIIEVENAHAGFEIGSITKTFTGLMYANLLINKEISPKRKLSKDLDGAKILKKVPYHDLANHTSGFGRLPDNIVLKPITNPYKNYTVSMLAEFCQKKEKLASKPGTAFVYSNTGYALLALGLTKIFEVDYPVALQSQIFDKYGMKESSVERAVFGDKMVIPRDKDGKRTNYWDFWGIFGFGEINSSVFDLSLYMRTYFDKENLAQNRMLVPTFSQNSTVDIGISWMIFEQEKAAPFYFHDGGTNGFTSSICFEPISKKGVVVLSNLAPMHESAGTMSNTSLEILQNLTE